MAEIIAEEMGKAAARTVKEQKSGGGCKKKIRNEELFSGAGEFFAKLGRETGGEGEKT